MAIIDKMLMEYQHEQANTRKLLERVPDEHWDYKPHEKSMSMGELASHIADNPTWAIPTMTQDVFEFDMENFKPFKAANNAELLAAFDKNNADAIEAMKGVTDEHLFKTWTMRANGQTMMEMPRIAVLRTMIISHTIHHRGQLEVYLRINDVPLPSLYGPSADEQPQF